jgi:hypothetical protein
MTKQVLTVLALSLAFVALSASPCLAQGKLGPRAHRPQAHAASRAAQVADATPAASTSYTFTLINFPGAPGSFDEGINLGATASEQLIAGGYYASLDFGDSNGFFVKVGSSGGATSETFWGVNISGSTYEGASRINNTGQIVGFYSDASGVAHGYELIDGTFTTINVPFEGAVDTSTLGINNAGDTVGCWDTGDDLIGSGYELIGGTYTSLAVPNQASTCATAINDNGSVVGVYTDASVSTGGGFLFHDGTYTTINIPSAL